MLYTEYGKLNAVKQIVDSILRPVHEREQEKHRNCSDSNKLFIENIMCSSPK